MAALEARRVRQAPSGLAREARLAPILRLRLFVLAALRQARRAALGQLLAARARLALPVPVARGALRAVALAAEALAGEALAALRVLEALHALVVGRARQAVRAARHRAAAVDV